MEPQSHTRLCIHLEQFMLILIWPLYVILLLVTFVIFPSLENQFKYEFPSICFLQLTLSLNRRIYVLSRMMCSWSPNIYLFHAFCRLMWLYRQILSQMGSTQMEKTVFQPKSPRGHLEIQGLLVARVGRVEKQLLVLETMVLRKGLLCLTLFFEMYFEVSIRFLYLLNFISRYQINCFVLLIYSLCSRSYFYPPSFMKLSNGW